jgi:hypothetical protein
MGLSQPLGHQAISGSIFLKTSPQNMNAGHNASLLYSRLWHKFKELERYFRNIQKMDTNWFKYDIVTSYACVTTPRLGFKCVLNIFLMISGYN